MVDSASHPSHQGPPAVAAPYLRPTSIAAALQHLADGPRLIVAGCTDVFPAHVGKMVVEPVLDLTGLRDARGIREESDHWRIGALTTWADVAEATLPPAFNALQSAARQIGGVQIQNAGTLGGNLCNASPAADGVPALLILDAEVELCALTGTRRLALAEFILGNRQTALRSDEILTAIRVPKTACGGRATFLKLGARAYQVISIVMVAARLEVAADGSVAAAAIAVGACSPVARRLPALEAALIGTPGAGDRLRAIVRPEHLHPLAPITDVRATADYRREAALILVRRALSSFGAGAP
ncbi:MAG: FAD binding domain-containing protein [Defluviicoccus sp.]|nr:FAD binding domain-containing protein [Defluviicoccus sp.]